MAEEQAQTQATQEAPSQAKAAEVPQLSIADLQALMNIIDVALSLIHI